MRMLCAFMGWPAALHEPLRQWSHKNHAATLAQDRAAMASVAFEFDGHIRAQLGAGIHVCPGAPLARLQLRIAMERLLACTRSIERGARPPVRAQYPAGGWSSLPLRIERA